eukprot:1155323-Pelagomonas_calceolata.AAC.3
MLASEGVTAWSCVLLASFMHADISVGGDVEEASAAYQLRAGEVPPTTTSRNSSHSLFNKITQKEKQKGCLEWPQTNKIQNYFPALRRKCVAFEADGPAFGGCA